MSGTSGPSQRPPLRRPSPRHYPPAVYWRRRLAVVLGAALVVAVIVGIVSLFGGNPGNSGKGAATATSRPTTSATTAPAPASGIGLRTVTWTDTDASAGGVVNPAPGGSARPRTLVTEIWYPSIGGSRTRPTVREKPDYGGGPYPVIVFAHGFDTLPATYTPLLASWVNAGFVVVAPFFPDENADEINSLGNATPLQLETAESDVVNEPYDIAYVVGEVESGATGAASSGAPWLKGLVQEGKYALAGHSDGAQAVVALVYAQAAHQEYATTYADLATPPFAVVILSGSELSGRYAPPASPPPLLFVQSALDACNLPQQAATLLHDVGGGFFLKLLEASHFSAYVGRGRAAPIVEKVTVAFLEAARSGQPRLSELSPFLLPAHVAALYPPSAPPVLTALQPTTAEIAQSCAAP